MKKLVRNALKVMQATKEDPFSWVNQSADQSDQSDQSADRKFGDLSNSPLVKLKTISARGQRVIHTV